MTLAFGGVSFVELLILYERWAGERLSLEMSVPKSRRLHRSISMSAVPAGPSIDMWRSCRFLVADDSCLGWLAWWFGQVSSLSYGANDVVMVLRLGPWRLLMLAFLMIYFFFLDTLLGLDSRLLMVLLGCGIVLQIFFCKKPTWRLPHSGGVAALVDAASLHTLVAGSPGSGDTPSFSNFGDGKRKRIRLTKKTNCS